MTDQQVMSSLYQSELSLKSHVQHLDDEQKEQLESIVMDLQDLRKDIQPDSYFGDLE